MGLPQGLVWGLPPAPRARCAAHKGQRNNSGRKWLPKSRQHQGLTLQGEGCRPQPLLYSPYLKSPGWGENGGS